MTVIPEKEKRFDFNTTNRKRRTKPKPPIEKSIAELTTKSKIEIHMEERRLKLEMTELGFDNEF